MLNDGAKLRQQVFSCMVFILSNFCNMNFDRLSFEIGLLKLSDSFLFYSSLSSSPEVKTVWPDSNWLDQRYQIRDRGSFRGCLVPVEYRLDSTCIKYWFRHKFNTFGV